MVWNILLANLGQLDWLCPLPGSCLLPSPLVGEGMSERQHCSAVAKTLVCYQHPSSYQCKAQHCKVRAVNFTSVRPNTISTPVPYHLCHAWIPYSLYTLITGILKPSLHQTYVLLATVTCPFTSLQVVSIPVGCGVRTGEIVHLMVGHWHRPCSSLPFSCSLPKFILPQFMSLMSLP